MCNGADGGFIVNLKESCQVGGALDRSPDGAPQPRASQVMLEVVRSWGGSSTFATEEAGMNVRLVHPRRRSPSVGKGSKVRESNVWRKCIEGVFESLQDVMARGGRRLLKEHREPSSN